MSENDKTFTSEEVKVHGKEFIAQQAKILRKNLREKKQQSSYLYV